MEPDVIRMYSSSPPPLDDGTEFDEDEFGEFGGFSGVGTSTLGYNDFDLEDPHENFMSQNHFVPGHEYSSDIHGFADFHSAGACDGKDFVSDFSKPMSNDMAISTDKDATQSKSSRSVFECTMAESIEQTEVNAQPAILTKDVIAIDLKREEQEQCYNDSKTNPEVLTNGYSTTDSIHSQGIENMINTNDQKAVTVHISELCSDVKPSLVEDFSMSENAVMSANLTEEKTRGSLSIIGKIPLMQEHDSGNPSVLGKLPVAQVSLDLAVDSDELKVVQEQTKGAFATSDYENVKGTIVVDYTQSGHSELNTTVDTGIPNGIQNSSESMEHIEIRDQNTWQAVHESLGTVKEITSSVIQSETSPSVNKMENTDESDLETCNHDEETLGVYTHSIVCNELVAGQDHVVIEELPATNIERTEENESDGFGISRSKCSPEGDFSTFTPVINTSATEDVFSSDVQPVDSDGKNISKLTTEEFATFQEAGVKDEFGDFDTTSNDCVSTFASFPEKPPEKRALSEAGVYFEADLAFDEHEAASTVTKTDDFGEFGSTQVKSDSEFAGFNNEEDFSLDGQDAEWNAFGDSVPESTSWAAFGEEQSGECKEISECNRTEPSLSSNTQFTDKVDSTSFRPIDEMTRTTQCEVTMTQVLLNRLGRIFQTCFPPVPVLKINEEVSSLRQLLQSGFGKGEEVQANNGELLAVWTELQDVEDAHGLRYQWGGSHSNKKLLISLGIDTRNILFTGQRKQPVIVPAYASGLGMLEPTKEPVKPISAAEKIASIGQTPTASVSASEDHVPPVQFDWSSSGLTNPLDGVDPELYELTTSKLEGTNTVNRMTDAFARLMSTAEKTSTSSRKPKKEEILSNEAAQVIASLPDLSFMHAKVLMFPATLTPLVSSHDKAD
ncbi:aftiphilin-like isoform X2 [Pristis pectinata]|uniref:aftiphilin-like isoform X2 n=1 Tax=Pristis pectinata TaxID=685728 RepID=UPI00223C9324|nr:aftiphilin-like isoform X2 [Pristis pectinata]